MSQGAALNSGAIFILLGSKVWLWEQFKKGAHFCFGEHHLSEFTMEVNEGVGRYSLCLKPHSLKSVHLTGFRDTLFESREAALHFEYKIVAVD